MPHYTYLIIGGGMTAQAAIDGIREIDERASIGLVGTEPDRPYKRPPLSKGLWKGDDASSIWYDDGQHGAELHLGRTARQLTPGAKQVLDDQGAEYTYDRLLLATGGSPKRLPFGDGVNYYRTVEDYRRLRDDADRGRRFAVIGGGFIGSEIAAALAMNGREVTMVFPEAGICERMLPADLAQNVTAYFREKGVDVLSETMLTGIERSADGSVVAAERAGSATSVTVDGVVAGIGIAPNVDLAKQAGLAVEDGVVVDEMLRSTNGSIFAAGDVASFVNPALGKRMRVEHEDNANTMGRTAGRNMAGAAEPYHHLPFFYSDLFELGYEAVGELDSRLETVSDWKEPYREGVVYYLRDSRVRGVLLWNVWDQVDAARALIANPGPFTAKDIKGRLPPP